MVSLETVRRGRTSAPLPLTTGCKNSRLRGLSARSLFLSLSLFLSSPLSLPADRPDAKKKIRSEKGRGGTMQTRRMSSFYLYSFHSFALHNTTCVRSSVCLYVRTHHNIVAWRRLSTCRRKVSRTRRVEGAECADGASSDRSGLGWLVSCSFGPWFDRKRPIHVKITAAPWHKILRICVRVTSLLKWTHVFPRIPAEPPFC